MTETTVAVGDLFTAVPSLWQEAQLPLAMIAIAVGAVVAIIGLHRGFGTAAGKAIGGIALAVLILGGVGIAMSLKATVDKHGGGITTTGQFG
ncbi:MAG: hypothetical protein K0U78_20200 [Actinomycetia bacterium]|nr:hypothetical protein [Actinomycetes bacterium]